MYRVRFTRTDYAYHHLSHVTSVTYHMSQVGSRTIHKSKRRTLLPEVIAAQVIGSRVLMTS